MVDGVGSQIATLIVPPLLGLLIWFLSRLVTDNENSHSSFTKEIRAVRNEITELSGELVRLNVVQPKELKEISKELRSAQVKITEVERKVDGGRLKTEVVDGGTKINYGHFPEAGGKIIVVGKNEATNSAFKVEMIERVERTETQLKVHGDAIGRVSSQAKEALTKIAAVIPLLKETRGAVAKDILEYKKKIDKKE